MKMQYVPRGELLYITNTHQHRAVPDKSDLERLITVRSFRFEAGFVFILSSFQRFLKRQKELVDLIM